jgi:cupin 2 domain-containing protein
MRRGNLLTGIVPGQDKEQIDKLVDGHPKVRVERIVSTGQSTPPGYWHNPGTDEFVVLLAGAARVRFELGDITYELKPGDWVEIPAHTRHRVEWTQHHPPTVWLAVHTPRG